MKINELLNIGYQKLKENNIEDGFLKAKLLLSYILKVNKEYLIINNNKELKQEIIKEYNEKINKLVKGIPIQYLTNKQEFMGLQFYVDENVLIPQPDTEILVEETLKVCKNEYLKNLSEIQILDLCTGSGCIAISIAKNISNSKVTATDISTEALKIAQKNAIDNCVKKNINIMYSNMFNSINKKFNIIVSNPPYIETETIQNLDKEVKNEPYIALNGGTDGLDFYKIIAENAYKFLNDNGFVLLEIGYNQKKSVIKLLNDINKYKNIKAIKDLSGNDRVIIAKKG